MAAWWAAGTRSRSPGRGRVAAVGALSDQASGDGYHGHILPDLGISGLDTGGILGAFHGYADQTIISIIEDSSPAESKSSLDEESEATLLTALTEILDMVDDENPSPFDTLPDTELFSSPKDVPDSLLGVERHSWASFPDAAKDLFICLEPAIPRGPVRCSERTIKGSFGQESSLHDAGDADGSLDTSLGPQPEAQPDDMGLDDSMEPEAELIGVGLEDDAGLVFDQSLPCVINVSNVSLPELVRYVHPYCLPAEHHTIQLDVQIVQDAELETGRAAIQCEGQEVDAVPLVAGELAPETLPGLHGVGTVVETGSGTTSGPSIVPTAPQQGDAPARRRRGRPRKVAGLAVAGVTRGPATAPLTRSARRAQLLVTAGEGPAHGRPQTEPPPNTAQGGPIRGRALSRGRGRRGVMSKRPPGAGTPTQGGSGAGDPSPCKEAVVVPEPLPAQAVQPALISSSTIQPPPASDTLATIPSPALQPPPISDPLPTNPSPAPQPPPTSDPLPTNPSPASQPPPISDPPPTNPSPALQPPPISDPPPTNPSPAPQPPPISATLPTNPSPALQPPPTSDPLASPEAPQELSPTLEEAERSAVTPTLTLDHPPGVATPALSAATPAAAPGPVTQPPAAPPSGEHRQRPISLQQYRQRLQQRQQGEASPASRVPRPGSRPPAHAWPVVPIHSIVQGELSILPLDSVMTGDRSVPPATRQGSGPALPWGQTPIVTTPATRHVPPTHPHCQPPAVSCPHPAPTTAALPTHALPPSPPHTPVHSSRVRATSLELSPALTHPVPALAHPATALTHPALTHPALTHPALPHPALPHPTLPPPLLHPTAALPLCHPVASTPLPYSAPTLPLPNPVPALPLPRTVPHLAPTLSYPTTALPRSHPPPTLGCLGHPLTARSPSVGPSPRPLGAAVPAPPSGVLPPPALGGRRSLLTQADPIPAPKGPAPSLGPKAPPPRPTATQQRCSRAAARETSRSRAAAMQKIAAISGVEGIEAADLMSLLEQFEVTEVRKEPSVLSTGTEPAAGRRFADQVFGAELASTAGLTPPATPPHQYWISPPPTVTAGDAHPGGSAEIAPASPPPLGWLIQPAKCVGPPTPPSDPRSSPTLLTDPRTKPTSPSHPRTKPILTSDSRNKPNLPSDPRIMPSYPRPSPTLPYDPIASLTLPSDPSTSPIPSPDPRTSSSMPYDLSAPPSDLRFPPSDPSLVPTPAPCFDHQYCLPCGVRKTLSPSALAPSSLPPTSLPPSALPDVGCRWNVRRQHGITIKPITLLSRRATEASDRVMTAEAPSPRGPASGPVAGVDTTPCSRLDPGPIPPGSAQHGQKTSLESPQQSPQTHVSPCYSRDCSTSSSSGSSSRSRSRSPAQKRRRYCRRRSRRSRHSSRSDSRSSSRSRSYSRSSSWSTSASRSRSRSRSPQSCSVRMSYFEELEPFEDSRHRYRTSRHQAVEHKISRSRELAIEERRVVYVGKIRNGMKREELRRRFEVFGEIEDCNIYFRTQGDNYGFVTFRYTCDAFAAIENGQTVRRPDEMPFDLCFGGRRQFCKTNYADLDSNHSEVGPYSSKSKFDSLDFDTLLKQAKRSARR